jgi:hypothetical protein
VVKRGTNKIDLCLFKFLGEISAEINRVIMYSDCCGGQNKNSIIMVMYLSFLKKCESISVMDHKFMFPGHTRI